MTPPSRARRLATVAGIDILTVSRDSNRGIAMLPLGARFEPAREIIACRPEVVGLPGEMLPIRGWTPPQPGRFRLRGTTYPGGFSRGSTDLPAKFGPVDARTVGDAVQLVTRDDNVEHVATLRPARGFQGGILRCSSSIRNRRSDLVTLDAISAVTVDLVSSLVRNPDADDLLVHTFRSSWSREAVPDPRTAAELGLERSWSGAGTRVWSIGQTGSMPVNGSMPLIVVEDRDSSVCWGVLMEPRGPWRLEIQRSDDFISIVGSYGGRLHNCWSMTLEPDETYTTADSLVCVVSGTVDDCLDALRSAIRAEHTARRTERLGRGSDTGAKPTIVFNDWCATWGRPSLLRVQQLVPRLASSPVTHYVIDAGWYRSVRSPWDRSHGDWVPNDDAFPGGMNEAASFIQRHGLVPGLWFELETVGIDSDASERNEFLLQDASLPITTGTRRFLDMRKTAVHAHLARTAGRIVNESGFEFVKLDYNETTGAYCDGPESAGRNLEIHLEAAAAIFRRDIFKNNTVAIENCASGGHRLCPPYLYDADISSFSDAHESVDIPIIAANLVKVVPPETLGVWCVVRPRTTLNRLSYSLAAACIGLPYISGDIDRLAEPDWDFVRQALSVYRDDLWTLQRRASVRLWRSTSPRHLRMPEGFQIVEFKDGNELFWVVHRFAAGDHVVDLPFPAIEFTHVFFGPSTVDGTRQVETLSDMPFWSGCVAVPGRGLAEYAMASLPAHSLADSTISATSSVAK